MKFLFVQAFFVHQVATHATKMHCSRLVAWCCNEIMVAAMMFMKLRAAQIAMPTAMMENGGPNPLNLNFNSLQYPTLNRNHKGHLFFSHCHAWNVLDRPVACCYFLPSPAPELSGCLPKPSKTPKAHNFGPDVEKLWKTSSARARV